MEHLRQAAANEHHPAALHPDQVLGTPWGCGDGCAQARPAFMGSSCSTVVIIGLKSQAHCGRAMAWLKAMHCTALSRHPRSFMRTRPCARAPRVCVTVTGAVVPHGASDVERRGEGQDAQRCAAGGAHPHTWLDCAAAHPGARGRGTALQSQWAGHPRGRRGHGLGCGRRDRRRDAAPLCESGTRDCSGRGGGGRRCVCRRSGWEGAEEGGSCVT